MKLIKTILFLLLAIGGAPLSAEESSSNISYPDQLDVNNFDELFNSSPFQRTINIEGTYSLRAVVTYGDISYARVYNNITKKTITVELNGQAEQGLKLIKIINPKINSDKPFQLIGDDYLSQVTAQISFAGELAELKYDPAMVDPASRKPPSRGNNKGGKGGKGSKGGKGNGPSSFDRETYHSLSDAQRDKLHSFMRAQRNSTDISREERFKKAREAMQTLSNGGEITIPGN